MIKLKMNIRAMVRHPIFWALALGLGIRVYAGLATAVVNPDGLLYLHQARALYYGQWDQINTCQLHHLSILPPLISAAFFLLGDWVAAGRFISLSFGFATLIPLYCILKRFVDRTAAFMAVLIYAFIPALVGRSADILRDPIFWFLLSCALLMFIRHVEAPTDKRVDHHLWLSSALFIAAATARVEGFFFLCLSWLYLALAAGPGRLKRLFWFSAPPLLLLAAGLTAALFMDAPFRQILRLDKYLPILKGMIASYQSIRTDVAALSKTQAGPLREYLKHAGDFIWIVPFGPLLDVTAEKFFYPFVFVFLAGFSHLRQRIRNQRLTIYFLELCVGAIVLLYVYLLATWLIYDRFLVNLILPAVVLVGYGCDNILRWLRNGFHLDAGKAAVVLGLLVLVFGLGKNLRPRYEEKSVFPRIAQEIVQRKSPGQVVCIAAPETSNAYEWVFFYANQDVKAALCADALRGSIAPTYADLTASLRANGIRYLLWSDKSWPYDRFDPTASPDFNRDFELIGQWAYNGKETFRLLALR